MRVRGTCFRLWCMQTTQTDRRSKRPARSRADWLEEVKRWRQSGQRAGAYARAHGIHPGKLACWGSLLRAEVAAALGPKAGRISATFVPVRITAKPKASKSSAEQAAGGEFEVVLTNGRRVRFTGAYSVSALGRVLDAVEGRSAC